jgi:DNA gyrase inhibitor GyrI
VPARTVAVLRYSGTHDQDQMARRTAELRAWLADHRYTEVSPPQSAGYDPPWTVPWARRNEVLIAVSALDPR